MQYSQHLLNTYIMIYPQLSYIYHGYSVIWLQMPSQLRPQIFRWIALILIEKWPFLVSKFSDLVGPTYSRGTPYGVHIGSGTYWVATLRRRIFFFCDFQDFVLCSDISWYKILNSLRLQFHLDSSMGITSAIDDEISGQTSAMAHQFEKEWWHHSSWPWHLH